MAPLGALSQAWVSAQSVAAARLTDQGLWRFGDVWVALSEGPSFDDDLSGSGQFDYQALQRLADAPLSSLRVGARNSPAPILSAATRGYGGKRKDRGRGTDCGLGGLSVRAGAAPGSRPPR
jgi:hypothetical protein